MSNIKLFLVLLLTMGLIACTPTQKTDTNKKPAPQTAAASSVPQNNTLQVSGSLTPTIGKVMDAQDEVNIKQALIKTPVGQEAVWTNTTNNNSYIVRPINEYQSAQAFCRQSQIIINNSKKVFNATVCKGSDSKWYIKQ